MPRFILKFIFFNFQEEQRKRDEEEAEEKVRKEAKKAAALAKKQARLQGKQQGEQIHLPKLVSSTYSDLKKRFQSSPKQEPALSPQPVTERPKVGKLLDNPFEQKKALAEDADKKAAINFKTFAGSGISTWFAKP